MATCRKSTWAQTQCYTYQSIRITVVILLCCLFHSWISLVKYNLVCLLWSRSILHKHSYHTHTHTSNECWAPSVILIAVWSLHQPEQILARINHFKCALLSCQTLFNKKEKKRKPVKLSESTRNHLVLPVAPWLLFSSEKSQDFCLLY